MKISCVSNKTKFILDYFMMSKEGMFSTTKNKHDWFEILYFLSFCVCVIFIPKVLNLMLILCLISIF